MTDPQTVMARYHTAWSNRDLRALSSLLAPDFVTYDLNSGEGRDRDWEINNCRVWHDAFSDSEIEIQQMVMDGDVFGGQIAVRWLLTATHSADFMGVPASGKTVRIPGMEVNRVENGLIVETWRLSDTFTLLIQLDVKIGSN
ncbi:MAG: ester cyclase [Chloroflexota bacterium]